MPAPAASALQTQSPRGGEQTAKLELEIVSRAKREPKVRREGGSRSGVTGSGERGRETGRSRKSRRQRQRQAGARRGRDREGGTGRSGKQKDSCSGAVRKEYLPSSSSVRGRAGRPWDGSGIPHIAAAETRRAEHSLRRGTKWEFSAGVSGLAPSGESYSPFLLINVPKK